ncbi:unnamed protein product [Phyllotreta striolata]|uniref:WD repeat-containing protein on Y chromosome n=1 Tax=Phyllotreta striolata TaxID=444603 RepID=A0A9N9TQI0_PHYSR|nr:unnamed protein product [Phyllotreta striolata]
MSATMEEESEQQLVPQHHRKKKNVSLPLHKLLSEFEILKIKEAFERQDGRKLNAELLRDTLDRVAQIHYDDSSVYDIIFRKMNTACNGVVTWNEFISYLILGYEQEEVSLVYKTLDAPIPVSALVQKTCHRHSINRIRFFPTVKPDRSTSWHDGSIISSSLDGSINYWSLDLQLQRKAQSTCPYLTIQSTYITDMVVLPDVGVICTSSTERDLRFYDTSARKFELRVMIVSCPNAVNTMYYTFDTDIKVPSKLVCGDLSGSIVLFLIDSEARGPFKSQPGLSLRASTYKNVLKNWIPGMKVLEIDNIHTDIVRSVYYYSNLHSVVSCAQCYKAVQITDILDFNKCYSFKIFGGVWSFAVSEEKHILATGGPDCLVRLWNPFVPMRATCIFYGHHTGIVQMVFQDNGEKLYTLSKDKCIKVWDVAAQELLQTYLGLPLILGENLTSLYNPESRQWIIASHLIATIPLSPKQSSEHTDGNTHTSGVSVILFNKLFQCIVSCGLDSYIIVWEPWDGRRLLVIRDAHTVILHGEKLPVEITAATFDPGWQRLLTGAHDGTLKIWNFNTGTCLRNLSIEPFNEVQSVVWVKGRILASGWNRRITEFADTNETEGPSGAYCKNWDLRHAEDICTAVIRLPESLATGSYDGEMILWRLETGQPYKKFNVQNPHVRIKLFYQLQSKAKADDHAEISPSTTGDIAYHRPSTVSSRSLKFRRVSSVAMPDEVTSLKKLAVHCMMFLNARKTGDIETGTLLVALENGYVQVWNHMDAGGFITSFLAIHKAGDYVITMTSDINNEFVIMGTTSGYIKTFLLKNYCVPESEKEHICMPKYRLKFPFMWGDRILGRAQRMIKRQPFPVLLNSYKGHFMPVSGLTYIDKCEIIVSCSADFSCRMWTIGGRYLQTLGTFKQWKPLNPNCPVDPETTQFAVPPDVNRVASSTTLRVLMGGSLPKRLTIKQYKQLQKKERIKVDATKIYGTALNPPYLGHHYAIPKRYTRPKSVKFNTDFLYVPVYGHLITPPPVPVTKNNRVFQEDLID